MDALHLQKLSLRDAELTAVAVDRVDLIARLAFRLEDGVLHNAELRGCCVPRSHRISSQSAILEIRLSVLSDIGDNRFPTVIHIAIVS
jgi:hypothetical protein